MREKSLIKENILQYLDFKGISKYEFYQKTGVSNGVLSQKSGMSEENTLRFLSYYQDVNPNWLLTGKGEMLKDNIPPQSMKEESIPYYKKSNMIPLYEDVQTIGGSSIVANVEPVQHVSEWIDAGDWFPGATAAIRHYGDSMNEYPSGCILALKEVIDRNLIVWGRNYCVETSEYRVTKKLYDNDKYIKAYSTNMEAYPDGQTIHPAFNISKEKITRMYQVLGYVVKEYSNGPVPVYIPNS